MAKVLFIKRDDLVRNSVISGNVDSDKFLQFIEIAQEIHWYVPMKLVYWQNFNSGKYLKNYEGPLTIFHGTNDDVIPMHHSKKLYDSVPSNLKKRFIYEDTNHYTIDTHPEVIEYLR